MYHSSNIINLITKYCNSQIYANNPKDSTKKDLFSPCKKFFPYVVMKFLLKFETKDNIFFVENAYNKLKNM